MVASNGCGWMEVLCWGRTHIGGCEGEHGQEDDSQFGFRHLGADGGQHGHDGARLTTQPQNVKHAKDFQ